MAKQDIIILGLHPSADHRCLALTPSNLPIHFVLPEDQPFDFAQRWSSGDFGSGTFDLLSLVQETRIAISPTIRTSFQVWPFFILSASKLRLSHRSQEFFQPKFKQISSMKTRSRSISSFVSSRSLHRNLFLSFWTCFRVSQLIDSIGR